MSESELPEGMRGESGAGNGVMRQLCFQLRINTGDRRQLNPSVVSSHTEHER